MAKHLILLLSVVFPITVFGYGLGISTHPLGLQKKIINAEVGGVISNGTGAGVQARYVQKINPVMVIDGGIGASGGDRSSRFFLGSDFLILPDYGYQPRFSLKTTLENAKEFGGRHNILSVSPTVSKGFSFWGYEAYPFVGLPVGLNLDNDSKTYNSQIMAALGATGRIPIKGYERFMANLEGNINIKDGYSSVFVGISYPLN